MGPEDHEHARNPRPPAHPAKAPDSATGPLEHIVGTL